MVHKACHRATVYDWHFNIATHTYLYQASSCHKSRHSLHTWDIVGRRVLGYVCMDYTTASCYYAFSHIPPPRTHASLTLLLTLPLHHFPTLTCTPAITLLTAAPHLHCHKPYNHFTCTLSTHATFSLPLALLRSCRHAYHLYNSHLFLLLSLHTATCALLHCTPPLCMHCTSFTCYTHCLSFPPPRLLCHLHGVVGTKSVISLRSFMVGGGTALLAELRHAITLHHIAPTTTYTCPPLHYIPAPAAIILAF